MTKVSAVHQQPGQVLSQTQFGAQREDLVPHLDSPTASQRASAMSSALVQSSCYLVCDCSEVPAAKEPTETVQPCCRGSWVVTWGLAWAKKHKAALSLCHYLLAQTHIHSLQGHLRLHCCCSPNASLTGWLGDWSSTLSSVNMYCCHEFRASQLKH